MGESDKGSECRICEEILQFNDKKKTSQLKNKSEQTYLQRRYMHGQQAHEKKNFNHC